MLFSLSMLSVFLGFGKAFYRRYTFWKCNLGYCFDGLVRVGVVLATSFFSSRSGVYIILSILTMRSNTRAQYDLLSPNTSL